MNSKPLHTVAKIIAGQSPSSSTYNNTGDGLPFFQGKADFQEKYPQVRMWCNSPKRKEAEPGDILISVRAPVGAVNVCDQRSIIGRGLSAIRPLENLDGEFLYYFLKSNEQKIANLGTGSTFMAITQQTLKKVEIPLPPLDDQKRIAHLLGKVEGLIARRKQHLQQLDDLLKSVFLEMFGDKGKFDWDNIGNLANKNEQYAISSGPFGSNLTSKHYADSGVIVLRGTNITEGKLNLKNVKYVSYEKAQELRRSALQPLDVVIIAVGSSGQALKIPDGVPDMIMSQNFNKITPDTSKIHPTYLEYCINSEYVQRQFKKEITDTVRTFLSLTKIISVRIPVPPIPLQHQFAAIVEKVEGIKFCYQQSLADLEHLYGALSQKAFKGELDLSRVPLIEGDGLPASDNLTQDSYDQPKSKSNELDIAQETDTDKTEFFNTWSFHEFLCARKDEVFTASDLWEALQQKNFQNPPPTFENFKTWILTCLEQGKWLEQVYGVVSADKGKNVEEKKVALRIRDDS